jgi:hypothetical protein
MDNDKRCEYVMNHGNRCQHKRGHHGRHYWVLALEPAPQAATPPLQEFWNAQSEWSQATFGSDSERGPIGPLKHLAKEAAEAQEHPTDPFEYADCLFLVFDSARRAGFTLEQLTQFCWQKLEINKARKYPKVTDMNAAVEHER